MSALRVRKNLLHLCGYIIGASRFLKGGQEYARAIRVGKLKGENFLLNKKDPDPDPLVSGTYPDPAPSFSH
jgi:hypothetical protein